MPQLSVRNHHWKTAARPSNKYRSQQKLSTFSSLKSVLCSCSSKADVIDDTIDSIENKQSKDSAQISQNDVHVSLKDSEASRSEIDTDVSLISLREAGREKINGVRTISAPHSPISDPLSLKAKSSPFTGVNGKKTLPPIEPIYRKEVKSVLKKAPTQEASRMAALTKVQTQESSEVALMARTRNGSTTTTCTSISTDIESQIKDGDANNPKKLKQNEKFITKHKAKIKELQKKIGDVEISINIRTQLILKLREIGDADSKLHIKKFMKSLKGAEKMLNKLRNELESEENQFKKLTVAKTAAIKESNPAKFANRAVSDTNTKLCRDGQTIYTRIINVAPASSTKVVQLNLLPMENVLVHPKVTPMKKKLAKCSNTDVRRFLVGSDEKVRLKEQVDGEVEKSKQKSMSKRPQAAHPLKIRSVTIPYELECFDSSESEHEEEHTENVGTTGMRKFEQLQKAKGQKRGGCSIGIKQNMDTNSDNFGFLGLNTRAPQLRESGTAKSPTKCTNAMAKQIL